MAVFSKSPPLDTNLKERLRSCDQEHLLRHAASLTPLQRDCCLAELNEIDFDLIRSLFLAAGRAAATVPTQGLQSPPAIRLTERRESRARNDAMQLGEASLHAGEVAVVLVAGGQATRLGCDGPKGLQPVGPVSGASLFQLFFEQVAATGRRYRRPVPLLVMTSEATDAATRDYLAKNDAFGVSQSDLLVFQQGTMPAVDARNGRILLAGPGAICRSPDGHGGLLAAMERAGAFDRLRERGVKRLFYAQIDNPLTKLADPELIGWHLLQESEMTTLAVAKARADERVGVPALVGDSMQMIEYSDLDPATAARRGADGELELWAGNIAVHVMELEFLERMAANDAATPFHIARKTIPCFDPDGETVEVAETEGLKFEKFIFDILPHAANPLVIEVDRREAFAPLKNAPGSREHAPEHVRAAISARARDWLESVGAVVAGGPVEISPLFALGREELADKIAPGEKIDAGAYLRPADESRSAGG